MLLISNSAESSTSPHIPLLYLGLLGDANSHLFVGLSGPLRRPVVAKTVITPQVSDLVRQTSNPLNEFVFR